MYGELDPGGRQAARQVFLRLVTLGEGTGDTRRRVLRSELQALDDSHENNDVAAANSMNALLNYVSAQRGKNLTDAQADQLVELADLVLAGLNP